MQSSSLGHLFLELLISAQSLLINPGLDKDCTFFELLPVVFEEPLQEFRKA